MATTLVTFIHCTAFSSCTIPPLVSCELQYVCVNAHGVCQSVWMHVCVCTQDLHKATSDVSTSFESVSFSFDVPSPALTNTPP